MGEDWFRQARKFEWELSFRDSIFLERYGGIDCDAEFEMEIDIENDEFDAEKFRDYATECRRLARAASEKDRTVLIEIADAWIACAEQAERKAGCHRKQ
jgi:hypothetical protein